MAKRIIDTNMHLKDEDRRFEAISKEANTSFKRELIELFPDETQKTTNEVDDEENSLEQDFLNCPNDFDKKEWTW